MNSITISIGYHVKQAIKQKIIMGEILNLNSSSNTYMIFVKMLNHLMGIQLIFTNNFGWEWHITLLVTSPSLCMHISALNTTVPIQFVMYQHVSNTKPIKPLLWSTHHNPQVRSQTPDIAANIMQAYSSGNKAFETFCHIQNFGC